MDTKANILVVDDTIDNLRLLMDILSKRGYKTRPASNGLHALSTARANPPDLILLDILMAGMDGYEVCEQLKSDDRTRDIPVIFISALSGTAEKVKAFAFGGVDYVSKPFQPEEVLARVQAHIALQELHKNLKAEIHKREVAEQELHVRNCQLEDANKQLQEANANLNKLFSIVAHDLRNPFCGFLSLTELFIENFSRYQEEDVKKFIERLHTSAEKIYALLKNLLEWSRIERGLIEAKPREISLSRIASYNIGLFGAQAEQKQIRFKNVIPEDTIVFADHQMLDIVTRNLISNALKFTENGGAIEVSATRHDTIVEFSIADTGIGMDQTILSKLFQINLKQSRRGTAGEEGTGLGLILCKELVEKNKGHIRVESDVGKGTTFILTLPVIQS